MIFIIKTLGSGCKYSSFDYCEYSLAFQWQSVNYCILTVNALYNDIHYISKIRYNVTLVCTKFRGSLFFRWQSHVILWENIFCWYLLESPRRGKPNCMWKVNILRIFSEYWSAIKGLFTEYSLSICQLLAKIVHSSAFLFRRGDSKQYPQRMIHKKKLKKYPLFMLYTGPNQVSFQQQIWFYSKIFGNKHCRYNKGPLYIETWTFIHPHGVKNMHEKHKPRQIPVSVFLFIFNQRKLPSAHTMLKQHWMLF